MSTKTIDIESNTAEVADDGVDTNAADAHDALGTTTTKSTDVVDDKSATGDTEPTQGSREREPMRVRALRGRRAMAAAGIAMVVVALAIATGIFAYLYQDARSDLAQEQSSATSVAHAEKVALDYATGAAQMGYQDLGAWNKRLTAGTSPELASKLTTASSAMQQVIVPLQWNSTASPIAAQVKSHDGSTYVVSAFVSVMTKNAQAPDGVQSTASYTVTMDSSKNWLITDVGGLDGAVAPK